MKEFYLPTPSRVSSRCRSFLQGENSGGRGRRWSEGWLLVARELIGRLEYAEGCAIGTNIHFDRCPPPQPRHQTYSYARVPSMYWPTVYRWSITSGTHLRCGILGETMREEATWPRSLLSAFVVFVALGTSLRGWLIERMEQRAGMVSRDYQKRD